MLQIGVITSPGVFDEILAVDDFLSFKAMMVRRNTQLDVEALK